MSSEQKNALCQNEIVNKKKTVVERQYDSVKTQDTSKQNNNDYKQKDDRPEKQAVKAVEETKNNVRDYFCH